MILLIKRISQLRKLIIFQYILLTENFTPIHLKFRCLKIHRSSNQN